jgi:hypothetical protein
MTIEPDSALRRIGPLPWAILLTRPLIVTGLAPRAVGTLLKWLPALMTALRPRTLLLRRSLVLLAAGERQPIWRA